MIRFFLILLVLLLMIMSVAVCADEPLTEATEQSAETSEVPEDSSETQNVIRFVLIGGSVIGALCAITLLYKKKDEIKYL